LHMRIAESLDFKGFQWSITIIV